MHINKGYGITAGDDKMLQECVDDLVITDGFNELDKGEYQISYNKGINWDEDRKPPFLINARTVTASCKYCQTSFL